jgi:hypothetical protein
VTTLRERFETIERAVLERLPEFDVKTSSLPPPVAGSMRRALRRYLKHLRQLKEQMEEESENQTNPT